MHEQACGYYICGTMRSREVCPLRTVSRLSLIFGALKLLLPGPQLLQPTFFGRRYLVRR